MIIIQKLRMLVLEGKHPDANRNRFDKDHQKKIERKRSLRAAG